MLSGCPILEYNTSLLFGRCWGGVSSGRCLRYGSASSVVYCFLSRCCHQDQCFKKQAHEPIRLVPNRPRITIRSVSDLCEPFRCLHMQAVPFVEILEVLALWFCISVPMVFLGAYFGYRKPVEPYPVVTSNIPRQVRWSAVLYGVTSAVQVVIYEVQRACRAPSCVEVGVVEEKLRRFRVKEPPSFRKYFRQKMLPLC